MLTAPAGETARAVVSTGRTRVALEIKHCLRPS